jgi:hypothetical protein
MGCDEKPTVNVQVHLKFTLTLPEVQTELCLHCFEYGTHLAPDHDRSVAALCRPKLGAYSPPSPSTFRHSIPSPSQRHRSTVLDRPRYKTAITTRMATLEISDRLNRAACEGVSYYLKPRHPNVTPPPDLGEVRFLYRS